MIDNCYFHPSGTCRIYIIVGYVFREIVFLFTKLSIADGYDYSQIERLPEMQSLTQVEKILDYVG